MAYKKTEGKNMFNNIGRKIKVLASIIAWIGIIASIIVGVNFIVQSTDDIFADIPYTLITLGIGIMIVGSLLSWLSSFLLYGFGELIENSAIIAKNTSTNQKII